MLSHKMDFNCCANRDGFRIDSHNYDQLQLLAHEICVQILKMEVVMDKVMDRVVET